MPLLDLKFSRTYSVAYELTGKTKALYKCLFENLADFAEESGFKPNPSTIITGLELSTTKASKSEFQVVNNFCYFPSTYCSYWKIKMNCLTTP
jgi:hypothetical protein